MNHFRAQRRRPVRPPRSGARRLLSSTLPLGLLLAALLGLAAAPRPAAAALYLTADLGGGLVTGDPDDGEHKPAPTPLPDQYAPEPDAAWTGGPLGAKSGGGLTASCASAGAAPSAAAPSAWSPGDPGRAARFGAPWRWLDFLRVPLGGHLIRPLPFLLLGDTRS